MLKKIVIKRSIVIFGGYFSLTLKCVAFLFCLAIISESSGLVFSTVPASVPTDHLYVCKWTRMVGHAFASLFLGKKRCYFNN